MPFADPANFSEADTALHTSEYTGNGPLGNIMNVNIYETYRHIWIKKSESHAWGDTEAGAEEAT